VRDIVHNSTDAFVIARLGDDLDEFSQMVQEVCGQNCVLILYLNLHLKHSEIIDSEELDILQVSIAAMQTDIQLEYRDEYRDEYRTHLTMAALLSSNLCRPGGVEIVIEPELGISPPLSRNPTGSNLSITIAELSITA
jgi:hypothetical protein